MSDNPFNIPFVDDEFQKRSTGTHERKDHFSISTKERKLFMSFNPLFTLYFNDKYLLKTRIVSCDKNILPTNYAENKPFCLNVKLSQCKEKKTKKKKNKTSFMNVTNTFASSTPSHSKQLAWKEFQF